MRRTIEYEREAAVENAGESVRESLATRVVVKTIVVLGLLGIGVLVWAVSDVETAMLMVGFVLSVAGSMAL
jgi:uncharacterized membrane protein YiaA